MKISAANLPHLIAAAAVLVAIAAPAAIANAATSPRDADALAKATYIYIATVRKDGNQSKAAPVWFITTADKQVLIETSPTSWKAKRIKRGSPAMIWIGDAHRSCVYRQGGNRHGHEAAGPGDRRISQEISARPNRLCASVARQAGSGQIVVIRISPARDLPDGFQSAPGTPAPQLDEKAKPASAH